MQLGLQSCQLELIVIRESILGGSSPASHQPREMSNKAWHQIRSIWPTPVSVCLYLELICIVEVYAHSRDHPCLEQSCQDLFGNCVCDEVEVEWVSPDMRRERSALVQRFLIRVLKWQHQNLQSFVCVWEVKLCVYSMSGGVLLCSQNAETQFEHTWQ